MTKNKQTHELQQQQQHSPASWIRTWTAPGSKTPSCRSARRNYCHQGTATANVRTCRADPDWWCSGTVSGISGRMCDMATCSIRSFGARRRNSCRRAYIRIHCWNLSIVFRIHLPMKSVEQEYIFVMKYKNSSKYALEAENGTFMYLYRICARQINLQIDMKIF